MKENRVVGEKNKRKKICITMKDFISIINEPNKII